MFQPLIYNRVYTSLRIMQKWETSYKYKYIYISRLNMSSALSVPHYQNWVMNNC